MFARLAEYIADEIDRDDVGHRLKELASSVPTQPVWGEEDKAVPLSIGRDAQAHLCGVELSVIPQATHVPCVEHPDAFDKSVVGLMRCFTAWPTVEGRAQEAMPGAQVSTVKTKFGKRSS